jgi:hypothetical protein
MRHLRPHLVLNPRVGLRELLSEENFMLFFQNLSCRQADAFDPLEQTFSDDPAHEAM